MNGNEWIPEKEEYFIFKTQQRMRSLVTVACNVNTSKMGGNMYNHRVLILTSSQVNQVWF